MLLVYLIVGILNSIGLAIIGIPNPITYGFIASILTFVPYIGIIWGTTGLILFIPFISIIKLIADCTESLKTLALLLGGNTQSKKNEWYFLLNDLKTLNKINNY